MQRYSIIIAALMFVFFVSCSSGSKSQNDSDIIPDADSDGSDAETLADDFDSQDADIIDDKDQSDDSDSESNDPSQENLTTISAVRLWKEIRIMKNYG